MKDNSMTVFCSIHSNKINKLNASMMIIFFTQNKHIFYFKITNFNNNNYKILHFTHSELYSPVFSLCVCVYSVFRVLCCFAAFLCFAILTAAFINRVCKLLDAIRTYCSIVRYTTLIFIHKHKVYANYLLTIL